MLVVLGCLVALIAWQSMINKIYPPKPKAIKPVAAAGATNDAAPQAQVPAENPTDKKAEPVGQPSVEAEQPHLPEQIVTLSNDIVRMEFTTRGGGVRAVELLKHKVNGSDNVVLNGTNFVPALALMEINGAGPDSGFTVEQPAANTVIMKGHTSGGLGITKTFTLNDGFLLTGTVEIARIARAADPLPSSLEVAIGTVAPTTVKELPTYLNTGWLLGDKYQYRDLKQITKYAQENGYYAETASARWGAVKNQFFAMILTPDTNAASIECKQVDLVPPADWKLKEPPHGVFAALTIYPTVVTTNVSGAIRFHLVRRAQGVRTFGDAGQEPGRSDAVWVLGCDQRGAPEEHEVFLRDYSQLWGGHYPRHGLHQDPLLADPGEEHQVDEGHAEVPAVD